MNKNKKIIIMIAMIAVIVLILVAAIIYTNYEKNKEPIYPEIKENNTLKETDELVTKALKTLDIDYSFDSEVLKTLYSGKKVTSETLTNEQKMFMSIYMYQDEILKRSSVCSENFKKFELTQEQLSAIFEDNSYLKDYKKTKEQEAIMYYVNYENETYKISTPWCGSILSPFTIVTFENAEKNEDILTVNVKMVYFDVKDVTEEGNVIYETHKTVDAKSPVVETIEENENTDLKLSFDKSKYNTYKATYKIVDKNIKFISIEQTN